MHCIARFCCMIISSADELFSPSVLFLSHVARLATIALTPCSVRKLHMLLRSLGLGRAEMALQVSRAKLVAQTFHIEIRRVRKAGTLRLVRRIGLASAKLLGF